MNEDIIVIKARIKKRPAEANIEVPWFFPPLTRRFLCITFLVEILGGPFLVLFCQRIVRSFNTKRMRVFFISNTINA